MPKPHYGKGSVLNINFIMQSSPARGGIESERRSNKNGN